MPDLAGGGQPDDPGPDDHEPLGGQADLDARDLIAGERPSAPVTPMHAATPPVVGRVSITPDGRRAYAGGIGGMVPAR